MLKRRSLRSRIAKAMFGPLNGLSLPPSLCRWIGRRYHPLFRTTIVVNGSINLLHPFRLKRQNGRIMYAVVFGTLAVHCKPVSEPITITSQNNGDNPCDRMENGVIPIAPSVFPTLNGARNYPRLLVAFSLGKQDRPDHGTETESEDLAKSGQAIRAKTQINQTRISPTRITPA
jgi:hypothetical protein